METTTPPDLRTPTLELHRKPDAIANETPLGNERHREADPTWK